MGNAFKLANRVRELRRRLELRQADLAAEVDVTRQTIIAIEKGKLNPSIFICLKIARVLREPVDYVFFLDRADDAPAETPVKDEQGVVEDSPVPEPELTVAKAPPNPEPVVVEEPSTPDPEPVHEPAPIEAPPEPIAVEEGAKSDPEPDSILIEKSAKSELAQPAETESVTAEPATISNVDKSVSSVDSPDPDSDQEIGSTPDETVVKQSKSSAPAPASDMDVVEDPESDNASQTVWDF
jgi:putative transcriptional regulator